MKALKINARYPNLRVDETTGYDDKKDLYPGRVKDKPRKKYLCFSTFGCLVQVGSLLASLLTLDYY